jgi:hypothetical protein
MEIFNSIKEVGLYSFSHRTTSLGYLEVTAGFLARNTNNYEIKSGVI